MRTRYSTLFLCIAVMAATPVPGQMNAPEADVTMHLEFPRQKQYRDPPAVVWLKPLQPTPSVSFSTHGPYTLAQKNRTFIPHLLIVPVGSEVLFPNKDPFFHNVFSLFEGQRFDLGLYEAGSTKGFTFSRVGVSYIFCDIHPEMSAVVIALSTPLYAIADPHGTFRIHGVPIGEYELHVWIEGMPRPEIEKLVRRVNITTANGNLGNLTITPFEVLPANHLNKFGRPYGPETQPSY